jgi:hypothetical protein
MSLRRGILIHGGIAGSVEGSGAQAVIVFIWPGLEMVMTPPHAH